MNNQKYVMVPVELKELLASMIELHDSRGTVLTVQMHQLGEMLAAAPQPAEADGVEVVAVVKNDSPLPGCTDFMKYEPWMADGLSDGWEKLMTVAQHNAIVAALRQPKEEGK